MSSEKHLDGDTRELSEFEVLLTYARSATVISEPRSLTLDTLAGYCLEGLSTITKRLKELADQESTYKLKSIQTISRRHIYDAAVEQRRTEEDEKYGAILAARGPEEEHKRQMQMAEDAESPLLNPPLRNRLEMTSSEVPLLANWKCSGSSPSPFDLD
jgi:hypothetical protein